MNNICKEIFKAVHEGKWLSIEYRNKEEQLTKYWIGIKDIDLRYKSLKVEGLHLGKFSLQSLSIYIDNIKSAKIIDGSFFAINERLIKDIKENPQKFDCIFSNVANLKILNYLVDCYKLDNTPYRTDYSLLENFDEDCVINGEYKLSDQQFEKIVIEFQFDLTKKQNIHSIKNLCVNVMSVHTKRGLYVLAYRKLRLDVMRKTLIPDEDVTICHEFTIEGEKLSVSRFLDADDLQLVDEFDKNRELIKDKISENSYAKVDDMPYLMAICYNIHLDLEKEYAAVVDMTSRASATQPIKAFFGDVERRTSRANNPIALLNEKVNLDQLLAINTAMKSPLAYVQGPPGTGKTNTIINTISTAFFNGKTVLFSSYNNHPIDGVFEELTNLQFKGNVIPFPILRLGNNEKIPQTIKYIKNLYERVKKLTIYSNTLDKNREQKKERAKQLSALLQKHDELINLNERKDAIEKILSSSSDLALQVELQARQLEEIKKRIESIGTITDEDAFKLLDNDFEEYYKWLYYTSAQHIQRLGQEKYKSFIEILNMEDVDNQIIEFNKYIANDENFEKLLKVFPIIATTCISASKLGEPKQYFDMTIIDEASQCNTAVSLIPIIRGGSLMLVGDPQQLNPVILLDKKNNEFLRKKYLVAPEYDYRENSIYKTYLACDAVSDEILLSHHYRCHKNIIEFNNKKYYNNKLIIKSKVDERQPLVYVNVKGGCSMIKNTSPEECEQILDFISSNRDKKIGIITPFVNQKTYINEQLKIAGYPDVTCGTVHAFQGDEKDIILFSLALSEKTSAKTYDWLRNNKELINVAVSRAKSKLVLFVDEKNLDRLHSNCEGNDDIYELATYIKTNGTSVVTSKGVNSRALGVKPYSTETEDAFMTTLTSALSNINVGRRQYEVCKEVSISQVFGENFSGIDLFYTGRFDFVVMEKKTHMPVFAIELDGKEHETDEIVKKRDEKKNQICREHNFILIRVDNSYARRYAHIKEILMAYFKKI